MGKGELEVGNEKLLDVLALDVLTLLELNNLEDVNAAEPSTVSGSHVLVKSLDGGSARQVTVLLVHVVGARARVVSDPDTKVLDLVGVLLRDSLDANDLTGRLLDLSELLHEVPVSRLGNNSVGSEDRKTVKLRGGVGIGRQMTANDLFIFSQSGFLFNQCWDGL